MSGMAIIDTICPIHGVQYDVLVEKNEDGVPVPHCGVDVCSAMGKRWWGGYSGDVHGSGFAPYEVVDQNGNTVRLDTRDAESDYLKSSQRHYDEMAKRGYAGLAAKRPDKLYVMTEREASDRHAALVERNYELRRKNGLPTNNIMRDMRIKL